MGGRLTTLVSTVLAAASVEAGFALLPLSQGAVLPPLAAQQASEGPRYRPGAGLIDQIRSGDVYRFGGARAPGRDWAFGWKETITDPALSTYEIRDFQERIYGEATSADLPSLRRSVDLVIGVNLNQTSPVTDGRHWKVSLLPGEMFMHPSSTNQLPTARFTVPTAGEYTITGYFQNIGCGGSINGVVSVVSADQAKPAVQVLAERASNGAEAPYKIIRSFNKGDLIDFSVDSVGNYHCDSTRLDAQIVPSQRVAPHPPIGSSPGPAPTPGVETGQPKPPPPSQGKAGQAQSGKGQADASKSKKRPAPSGVLDVQVKWWLWPGNQAQPKPTKPDQSVKKPAPPAETVKPPKTDAPPVQSSPPPESQKPDQPKPEPPKAEPPKAEAPKPEPPKPEPPSPQPNPPQQQRGGVSPVDYSPLFARGVAKAALGDKRGAIADFNQAIAINPKLAPAYYSRGLAKWDLNDKAGACADFKTARDLGDVSAAAAERKSCPAVAPPTGGRL